MHLWNDNFANHRRVVCRRCHVVIDDFEPGSPRGEFNHPKKFGDGTAITCTNLSKVFHEDDSEVEPFVRKRFRRAAKRTAKRKPR